MGRIGELDIPDRLAGGLPRWLTAICVGLLAAAATGALRFTLDMVAPGAAVFSLVFPAAMIGTLFAGWIAGATSSTLSVVLAWYYLYPVRGSFAFQNPADAVSVTTVAITCVLVVALAETFRRAVRRVARERDAEIARRDLFLEEFDHRAKNNFALVVALLDMQRRRAGPGETADALAAALSRVESIARAHRHLYRGGESAGSVDMETYLQGLCSALAEALFLRGAITLDCRAEPALLPRDRAATLGLILNELVTNAAKHAFSGRDTGTIRVRFESAAPGWRLTVADDGAGIPAERAPRPGSGLGQRLIDGFVKQAGGTIDTQSGPDGTKVTVTLTE